MAAESTFTYHAGKPEPELVYAYKGELERLHAEIERLRAQYARLRAAAHEIYWSANWTADREVDHDDLWDELRDAGALEQSGRCPYYPGCQPEHCTRCWEHDNPRS